MATISTRIGPADRGRVLGARAYLGADYEPGYRYELARGVLEVTKVPRPNPHGLIVWLFLGRLRDYDRDHPGVIYRAGGASEFHIWLPHLTSGRNPDIGVALVGTPIDAEGDIPPSLAIEVVSRGARARRRDYAVKREEYLAYGLREYWIVDPSERRVTVLIRDGDAWVERVFADGQVAAGLVLPGFEVPVSDIWPAPEGA